MASGYGMKFGSSKEVIGDTDPKGMVLTRRDGVTVALDEKTVKVFGKWLADPSTRDGAKAIIKSLVDVIDTMQKRA